MVLIAARASITVDVTLLTRGQPSYMYGVFQRLHEIEGRSKVTEEQVKLLSKLALEIRSTSLSAPEKEALKLVIDQTENVNQLICVLLTLLAR